MTPTIPFPVAPGGVRRGRADIATARRRLSEIFALLFGSARVMSARILDVAEFEVKVAFGHHLQDLLEAAADLDARLAELGLPRHPRALTGLDARRLAAVLHAGSTTEVLAGLYRYWLPRVVEQATAYLDEQDAILDHESGRALRRALPGLHEMIGWGEAALHACLTAAPEAAGPVEAALRRLREGDVPEPAAPYRRPERAVRDPRFRTFAHTRDYRRADDFVASGDGYRDDAVELARVNRDEIDAIETFALAIYDLGDEAPLPVLAGLARIAADEARHAVIGHELLTHLGFDPFDVECSMIGINVRAAMPGWTALAQISLFGELGIIGPMRQLARRARDEGDEVTARSFEYICADELGHLTRVRDWLRHHHPAGSMAEIEEQTRQQAARRLAAEGVLGEDYYLALSKPEIARLLGE